jgi:hypothetical protein
MTKYTMLINVFSGRNEDNKRSWSQKKTSNSEITRTGKSSITIALHSHVAFIKKVQQMVMATKEPTTKYANCSTRTR